MATDWKIELCLHKCDTMYDDMVREGNGVAVELPTIPEKGDVVWPDDKAVEELDSKVRDCWKRNHCKDCPYIYGRQESVNDIGTDDYIWVVSRIFDMNTKTVKLGLSDGIEED